MVIKNFKLLDGSWAQYEINNRKTIWTESGIVWNNIRNRCNPSNKWQKLVPSYQGCTMSNNFKNFQFFVEWHMQQIGFGVEGYQIDKDILFEGNKEYHEDRCVIVPSALNAFFIRHNNNGLPHGVSYHKASGKFRATMTSFGKAYHIGLYLTVEEAELAYNQQKKKEALKWVSFIKEFNIYLDKRVLIRLSEFSQ